MAAVTQIDATLGETFDSGTVTRSIAVTAAAAADLHLLVQPAADAAPTADAVIAQGLGAAAVASSTFSAAGLASESDYVAYAVAKTGPTGSSTFTERPSLSYPEYGSWSKFGFSVSASADGSTIAVAIPRNDYSLYYGLIRIYDWDGSAWQHRAPDVNIGGNTGSGWAGGNVRISADGNTFVCRATVGAPVRRYDWDGTNGWNQTSLSAPADMPISGRNSFGMALDASDDCSVIVVGAPLNNNKHGSFHIYTWNGTEYVERLSDDTHGLKQGSEVAVSDDGSTVVVGGMQMNPNQVLVYQRNPGDTFVLKDTITHGDGVTPMDYSIGTSVALNSDGSLLAVGAGNYYSGTLAGRIEVYEWTTDSYTLKQTFDGTTYYSYLGGTHWTHSEKTGGDPPQHDVMAFGGAPGAELLSVTETDSGGAALSDAGPHYGIVRVFDPNTGTQIKELNGNGEYGRGISLSKNGKVVVVGAPETGMVYSYDIDDGSATSAVASQAFTTGDFTAPVVTAQIAGNARKNEVDIAVASSEDGTAYFAVAASAPSAAAVRASGTSAAITTAGLAAQTVPSLVSGTAQTVYVVVSDASGNLSLVHPVSFSTPRPTITLLTTDASTFEGTTLTVASDTRDGTRRDGLRRRRSDRCCR